MTAIRYGYLGPPGSFSEEAAVGFAALLGGADGEARFVPLPDVPAIVAAVVSGAVERGVAPIENSVGGPVDVTLDELISDSCTARIIGEVDMAIRHHLVVRPGTRLSDIGRISSHPQAISQCHRFLSERLHRAEIVYAASTSAAVMSLIDHAGMAALAGRRAATMYGMEVLEADVQDRDDCMTRFVMLGHGATAATGRDKTTICCATDPEHPGTLVALLGEFATRDINLTKIETRPRGRLGEYWFILDLQGHESDAGLRQALEAASARAETMRVLGSYAASPPPGPASG